MATNTYVALDKVTVGTATPTITFTGISQNYTDLFLVMSGSVASGANIYIRVGNGSLDTGSNYSITSMVTGSSSAVSERQSSQAQYQVSAGTYFAANEVCNIIANFQNYSNSSAYKTWLTRANSVQIGFTDAVGLWRSNSAINTISVYASQNFNTGTTVSLYGIAASGVTPAVKATGGAIYSDDLYYYHVFGSTGTFTPLQSLSAEYLIIAGGGGGGRWSGGGGGAGGYLTNIGSPTTLSATGYTITVGGGGGGSTSDGNRGSNGGNSSAFGITSTGGGGGGSDGNKNGTSGGSGGGGCTAGGSGGAGVSGQGFAGGDASPGSPYRSGGGGGAAQAGGAPGSSGVPQPGGNGSNSCAVFATATGTGVNGYYAGGGAAGLQGSPVADGGLGGGGKGGDGNSGTVNGYSGVISTGSGGGGGGYSSSAGNGGNGGSGLVIVRYAK